MPRALRADEEREDPGYEPPYDAVRFVTRIFLLLAWAGSSAGLHGDVVRTARRSAASAASA